MILALRRMLQGRQQQGPLESFCPGGVLCLGPKVTLKGFFVLFLSSEEQQSTVLIIFWRKENSLFILENYYLLCPYFYYSFSSFSPLWISSLLHFYPEGNWKVISSFVAHGLSLREGGVLAFTNWKPEPRLWEFRLLVNLQGWTLTGK